MVTTLSAPHVLHFQMFLPCWKELSENICQPSFSSFNSPLLWGVYRNDDNIYAAVPGHPSTLHCPMLSCCFPILSTSVHLLCLHISLGQELCRVESSSLFCVQCLHSGLVGTILRQIVGFLSWKIFLFYVCKVLDLQHWAAKSLCAEGGLAGLKKTHFDLWREANESSQSAVQRHDP